MKYSPRIYAAALVEALDGKSAEEQKNIAKRFWQTAARNRDKQKLGRILKEAEKIILKNTNTAKVQIESSEPVSTRTKHEIKDLLDKKVLFSEKTSPELFAGIKILINDELLIDATAQTRLSKLLSS